MGNVLQRFKEFIKKLQATTSRIEKENILKEYKNDFELLEILKFIYDPFILTGISKKKIEKNIALPSEVEIAQIETLMNYLKVNNTGRDRDIQIAKNCINCNPGYEDIIKSIITKDLKIGVQPKTLNKIYGKGFVNLFEVMLAQKYFDNPEKLLPEGTEFILSTKLDGIRCVCINEDGSPKFFTREGQPIEGLNDIFFECRALPDGHVYDGELLLRNDENLSSKELYRKTVSVVNSDDIKKNVIFNIFDILRYEDFQNGTCTTPCKDRKRILKERINRFAFQTIKLVDNLYEGTDQTQIKHWLDKITNEGGEGVMINIASAPYECRRTKNLLKVKKFETADVLVVDMEEGTGVNKGRLGALKIKFIGLDNKEYICAVGSGLSQEQRIDFWENPEKVLNKIIEIGYFEITQNKQGNYGLRFPTFKWIREDKTEISMN